MYHAHFGLKELPFSFSPSTHGLFMSVGHREGLAALEWGLREPSGFTMLIGAAGAGKTTLIHSLLEREYPGVRAACIVNPTLSFEEILRSVMQQLGMAFAELDKSRLLQAFAASIARLKPNEKVALILDEAQDLSDETLEELRLLSNFDVATPSGSMQPGPSHKALQIVLVGQLELAQRLKSPKLYQLDQRIGARAVLPPLRQGEIYDYIDYRVRALGGEIHRLFKPGALRIVARHSAGIPRRINVLCHNALMQAFAQGARRVTARHARAAVAEYDDLPAKARNRGGLIEWLTGFGRSLGVGMRQWNFALPIAFVASLAIIGTISTGGWSALRSRTANAIVSTGGWSAFRWRTANASSNAPDPPHLELQPPSPPVAPVQAEPAKFSAPTLSDLHAAAPAAGKKRAVKTVVVKSGDTLGKIAQKYLGSDSPAQIGRLLKANPQLQDPDTIFPGQIIAVNPEPGDERAQ